MLGTVAFLLTLAHPDVTGVVTSGGKPLTGAIVYLYTARPKKGVSVFCPSCYVDCGKRTTTDTKGRFRLPAVDPTLLFQALVIKDGYQPQFVGEVDSTQGAIKVAMKPRKTAKQELPITGRVLDEQGSPVEGATLEPVGWKTATEYRFGNMDHVEPLAVSDAKGRFVFHSAKGGGELLLRAEARGFAPQMVSGLGIGKEHPIVVHEGATIQGTVRDANGKGVGGVLVQVVPQNHDGREFTGVMTIGTDAQGGFLLPNVPADGSFDVYATMEGLAARKLAVPTKVVATGKDGSTSESVVLVASPAATLTGKLATTDGKPVPAGTRIMLVRGMTWDVQQTLVGKDGSFKFQGVPFDVSLQIHVGAKGYTLSKKTPGFRGQEPWGDVQMTVLKGDASRPLTLLLRPNKA